MNIIKTMNEKKPNYEKCIIWKQADEGLCIVRVYGTEAQIHLPGSLADLPVTEIGPYCFSASLPRESGPLYYSRYLPDRDRGTWENGRLPSTLAELESSRFPLCGNFIEEVCLPPRVHTLNNGAFYNCRKMTTLSVGPGIRGIGSDCFTNDNHFNHLLIRSAPQSDHGLKLLLERLAQDLTVSFLDETGKETCSLYFPEYYEWLDEISPAHIFSRTINGAGFRMRKCFQGTRLDFDKYDYCFDAALREESAETICLICLSRLCFPVNLGDMARSSYEEALRERLQTALSLSIDRQDPSLVSWLCQSFSPDRPVLAKARELCINREWGEGSSLLMELSAAGNRKNRFEFD